jgi:uncharacterized protein YodC (DUF2158 family)
MANIMVEFEVGDVVSLNSGGPNMTVSEIDGDNVLCQWFLDDGTGDSESFPKACVTLIED